MARVVDAPASMSIDRSLLVVFERPPPAELEHLLRSSLDADRLGELTFELKQPSPTSARWCVQLVFDVLADSITECDLLDPFASALARATRDKVWVIFEVDGNFITAEFDREGRRTDLSEREGLVGWAALLLGAKEDTLAPLQRVCDRLEGAPSIEEAKLEFDDLFDWVVRASFRLQPSAAAREASAQRERVLEEERREREREAAAIAEHNRAVEAARDAELERRRAEEEATLLDRELIPGEAQEVALPASVVRRAERFAKIHGVAEQWVLQAGTLRAIPWKFPATALPAVAKGAPVSVRLVVHPALREALAQSSLRRPDGSAATFDELVLVALSVGLDDLRDDLKDDDRKRRRLARLASRSTEPDGGTAAD